MDLYTVVTVFGTVIFTLGPWPDTAAGGLYCHKSATQITERARGLPADALGQAYSAFGRMPEPGDIAARCEMLEVAPELDKKLERSE